MKPVCCCLSLRPRQLRAAADAQVARIHGTPAADGQLRAVRAALQGPSAEHHGAPGQREYNSLRRGNAVMQIHRNLLFNCNEFLYVVRQDILCYGITSEKVVMRSQAETSLACAPTLTEVTCSFIINCCDSNYCKSRNN